ncbi:Entericidin B precursor [Cronobacter sakazakii 696]|nr:Entericidin B precursor [Cronobacter sakazakii 696]
MVKKTIAALFSALVLSSLLTEDIQDGGSAISGAATRASQ